MKAFILMIICCISSVISFYTVICFCIGDEINIIQLFFILIFHFSITRYYEITIDYTIWEDTLYKYYKGWNL